MVERSRGSRMARAKATGTIKETDAHRERTGTSHRGRMSPDGVSRRTTAPAPAAGGRYVMREAAARRCAKGLRKAVTAAQVRHQITFKQVDFGNQSNPLHPPNRRLRSSHRHTVRLLDRVSVRRRALHGCDLRRCLLKDPNASNDLGPRDAAPATTAATTATTAAAAPLPLLLQPPPPPDGGGEACVTPPIWP